MWVELMLVPNSGGERAKYPVHLEVLLSVAWACASQIFEPTCDHVTHLSEVDMDYWNKHGFYCAPQAKVGHDH